jgi:hypothetical protein
MRLYLDDDSAEMLGAQRVALAPLLRYQGNA